MSPAIEEKPAEPAVKPVPLVTYPETYHCPRCEGAIARECVARNVTGSYHGQRTQSLRLYCAHCDAAFEATFTIDEGRLIQVTQPTVLSGARLESFKNRIAQIRGDLRR